MTSELPQCPDVSSASGFGVSAEGQCSPASFTGEGAVIDVVQNAARTEYRIAFEGVEASEDCGPLAPSALIIVNAGSPVDVALGAGQSVNVVFHTLSDATAGNLWTYLELRDPNSGSLLFLHHFYDSRFLEAGHLHVGDEFSFKLAHPCRFEHACYRTAERYRLIDAERGIDVSEYESAEATVRGQRFGVYVRSARRQADFRQGECAGARADLGTFLALDIVARAPE
ncbi:MAG TPA: hypothetical protein VFS67_03395 [Polyangiaceae bacterium]|nr:hypothetical protein [Polyangiaceae bacterium]